MLETIYEWILGFLPIFIPIFFIILVYKFRERILEFLPIFIPIFLIVLAYNEYYDVALGFILGLAVMLLRNYLERRKNNKNRLNIDNLH